MSKIDKVIKILSIPHAALISVIFGIMLLSFPIGVYLVFNSNLGNEINFQYPLYGLNLFVGGINYTLPVSFQLGDGFIIAWSIFLILFAISFMGPNSSMMKSLSTVMSEGWKNLKDNGILNMLMWFSILILLSVAIDFTQESFGVKIESPHFQNELIHFFQLSVSPLTEETGFRVLLIGIPLFLIFSYRASWKIFFKSLWRPSAYLQITNYNKVMALVITVGIFFGAAHIIAGTPWSPGKITQAAIAGIIIGWVYVRYGLAPAILIHWGTNYFVYSYLFMVSTLSQESISDVISNPFSNTLEELLLIAGVLSLSIKILNHLRAKREDIAKTQTKI